MLWACFLDFVNALAGIGSAVAVFPVVKRVNESLALGFVMSRMVEAAVIMIGVVGLLTVVALRQDLAGSAADASALTTPATHWSTGRDWTFLFGPGFMAVRQRRPLRHPAVPVPAGAPDHPDDRADRRPAAVGREHVHALRPQHPGRRLVAARHRSRSPPGSCPSAST